MTDVLEGPWSLVLVLLRVTEKGLYSLGYLVNEILLILLIYQQFQEVSSILSPYLFFVSKVPVVTSRNNITLQVSEMLRCYGLSPTPVTSMVLNCQIILQHSFMLSI